MVGLLMSQDKSNNSYYLQINNKSNTKDSVNELKINHTREKFNGIQIRFQRYMITSMRNFRKQLTNFLQFRMLAANLAKIFWYC